MFRLKIKLGNDAMQTAEDVRDALKAVALRLRDGGPDTGRIQDANGNTVGEWSYKPVKGERP